MPEFPKKWVDVVFPHLQCPRLTYAVPENLRETLSPGQRVEVSIGRRRAVGFTVHFPETCDLDQVRDIEDVIDATPMMSEEMLHLTEWMAAYYITSWGEVIRAALPSACHRVGAMMIRPLGETMIPDDLNETQRAIMRIFENRDSISLDALIKSLKRNRLRNDVYRLEKRGLITLSFLIDAARAKPQHEKWIKRDRHLTDSELDALQRRAPKQAAIYSELNTDEPTLRTDLDCDVSILRKMKEKSLIAIEEREVFRDAYPQAVFQKTNPITLTDAQAEVVNQASEAIRQSTFRTFLLHGVTSSGKTQVYIEVIRKALEKGRSALILIPEIALTPQAVARYRGAFGMGVAVLHSRMSSGEKFDSWRSLREGRCRIALGPRSAIFAPLENLGLIIVDEEHETSYKQHDPAPRYHARDLAVVRGHLNHCVVLLGSATPSVESYRNAMTGKYTLCRLTERIDHVPMPAITLVDRNAVEQKNRVISPQLHDKIADRLGKREQVILLQNRRGYSTFLRCGHCGDIESCEDCDITLTYHQTDRMLKCHYCGFEKQALSACSKCGGANLKYRGAGTQRVEEELKQHFPEAVILRMDLDTTNSKHAHTKIVTQFESRKADILLGTQMVAKGHDFGGVTLVGIVSADTGLLFPDFRAEEHSFQMLTQAAGRAGRRGTQGEVIIQTFYPEHPIFEFVPAHDYPAFYSYSMAFRESLQYPPFGKILAIRFRGEDRVQTQKASQAFAGLMPRLPGMTLLGPTASPIPRLRKQYRFQIILKCNPAIFTGTARLRHVVKQAHESYRQKFHFQAVHIAVDVDPVDLL